jgi:hypothetical protein
MDVGVDVRIDGMMDWWYNKLDFVNVSRHYHLDGHLLISSVPKLLHFAK